jgi:LysM repeat protein
MENNDGNIKSQQTGGLKLMTVFIAVLALHVVVIGGFTVYHLMSGGSDVDTTLVKTPKDVKPDGTPATDGTTTDTAKPATSDAATTTASTTPTTDTPSSTEVTPAPVQPPAPVTTVTTTVSVPKTVTPAPAPAPAPTHPAPAPSTVATLGPTTPPPTLNSLAPPPEQTLSLAAPAPLTTTPLFSAPVSPGPVHMPATTSASTHPSSSSTHDADVTSKKETYTVKITDSYKKIAKTHHITVAQLKEANHIKDNTLHAGQKLVIPAGKTAIAKNDSSSESTSDLAAASTTSHHHTYTVEKGDTLAYIAKKFNTTKSAILAANDLTSSKLTPGKKLKIPSGAKEARSAQAATPVPAPTTQVRVQPQPAPIAQPAPSPQPVATQPTSPQPAVTPELANMTF